MPRTGKRARVTRQEEDQAAEDTVMSDSAVPAEDDGLEVPPELQKRLRREVQVTKNLFLSLYGRKLPINVESERLKLFAKVQHEYATVQKLPEPEQKAPAAAARAAASAAASVPEETTKIITEEKTPADTPLSKLVAQIPDKTGPAGSSTALTLYAGAAEAREHPSTALILKQRERKYVQPKWHAPWKTFRVISGHIGWVRCVAVDPANEWFCTGSADRTIKIWDLASGKLKLTLTNHVNTVTGLAVSSRHPYMFSCATDKKVLCWDLEQNKVIRSYHGHLSGVFSMALHPTVDVLITGGRDSVARVWDIRTKQQVRVLSGHSDLVSSIVAQPTDPQIITGAHDTTVRMWDLASGKCTGVLTNHKKSVRAMAVHPTEYTFATGAADNIKVWKCPKGEFLRNLTGHNAIINALCINRDDVLVSGADNGSLAFWDWKSGYNFQQTATQVQPGSLDAEAGIFQATFDMTGSRLITAEADKTIKIWKEDTDATEESHPINFKPPKRIRY